MTKLRKTNSNEYRFKIEAYSPETMPLDVLTSYLQDLAGVLGEEKNTHLISIEKGSTALGFRIDPEAQPKVHKRIEEIESGDAPPKVMEAYNRLNNRLRHDNAESGVIIAPSGDKLIEFPVKESPPVGYGPFNQSGTLDGIPVMVGGTREKVSIHLENRDGESYICQTTRSIAKQIAPCLFTTLVRVYGIGRWYRQPEGQWEMKSFKIEYFDLLADERDISLKKSIDELRAIPAKWKELDDPIAELTHIRYGYDEPIGGPVHNGHHSEG